MVFLKKKASILTLETPKRASTADLFDKASENSLVLKGAWVTLRLYIIKASQSFPF